ncbi:hypothetical protein KL930_002940 [Ogataea haglerorum]|nr:hypothetical protein KL923_003147 [Ogataea haglerorum]KAG7777266.1 hypothetical protein KL930_002940 [Ogataea haglerorum]KAG7778853.1 hypothetical protein KL922_002024 [Ogataea haglerorum]KAG7795946.1 hypothetical protein KL929_003708 [Ogataea haglerorum]
MSLTMTEKGTHTIELEKASEKELVAMSTKLANILEEKREAAGVSETDTECGRKGHKQKHRHHSRKEFEKLGRDFSCLGKKPRKHPKKL